MSSPQSAQSLHPRLLLESVINSSVIGVWAILACEKFVRESVSGSYLVVDVLNFDHKFDWAQAAADGDDDAILGAGSRTVVIPKPGTSLGPQHLPFSDTRHRHLPIPRRIQTLFNGRYHLLHDGHLP